LNCPSSSGERKLRQELLLAPFQNWEAGLQRFFTAPVEPDKTSKRATKQRCEKNNRGDWTPLELFLAGVRGCEAYPRRRLVEGMPVSE
jgi:hypothetical protein